jgi:hypothetical protein
VGSLTSIQHSILIGSILGDGSLRKQNNRLNALLEVNHSYKYKEYVDWKYSHFKDFVLTKPKARLTNGNRIAYRFTTQSLPIFTEYYSYFYKNGKKYIPDKINLDPLSLAVWFMDDGSKSRNSLYLNTQQFSISEQMKLQRLLLEVFNLKSTLNKDKSYFRIRITTGSSKIFKDITSPYICNCFKYKLTNDPVTTELKNEILI